MDKFGINNKKILGKTVIWGILILTIIGLSFSPVWGGASSDSKTTTTNGVTTTTLESPGSNSGECLSSSSSSSGDGDQPPAGVTTTTLNGVTTTSLSSSNDGCQEIPEYPTAAIPGIIAAGGYLLIRRRRLS